MDSATAAQRAGYVPSFMAIAYLILALLAGVVTDRINLVLALAIASRIGALTYFSSIFVTDPLEQ